MTRDISPDVQRIRLFLTEPHNCSYLPEKKATTAFVDPAQTINTALYSRLSTMGFRRSGKYLYTPRCEQCSACIPVRINVNEIKLNRQQKRCKKMNVDLSVQKKDHVVMEEHYPLYEGYIAQRHSDGDMFPPTQEQYSDFINSLWENSQIIEFRLQDQLVAASVVDKLTDGLSAIYTYFSTEFSQRSLGTYAILSAIDFAKQAELPYLYLGYWIKNCNKMSYKSRFDSLEMYVNGDWIAMNEPKPAI